MDFRVFPVIPLLLQTANLITNVDNAVIDGHAQTGRLITTMSNQLADTQLSRIKLH